MVVRLRVRGAILGLPLLTISHAMPAKRLGAFGLVTAAVTIPYHCSILGRTLPRVAFTNNYLRGD